MRELGRGVVVAPGADAPVAWADAPRIRVDDESATAPLHEAWSQRRPVVVELAIDAGELKRPETEARPPYAIGPGFEFTRERLHFLVWANTYDARSGEPVWWHGVRAGRLGAEVGGPADVVLPDGTPAWCDGGPRGALPGVDHAVVHRDSIDAGRLTVARDRQPSAALAP
ncbi:MAG: hypothetical protein Q8K72_09420, partial [Acidimicrobiales bacterium]|nr:hypothetical protein [Acidimicrobiales bacterium]